MPQGGARHEAWLGALLALDRNAPEFRDGLLSLVGETEEWADEGDVYFSSTTAGIELLTDAFGGVKAVLLFGPGSEDELVYRGELPAQLHFGLSRDEVRSLLGQPHECGESKVHLEDILLPWDKYRQPSYWLHVRYALDGSRIERVTIMPHGRGAV